jgi:hypothetical protein
MKRLANNYILRGLGSTMCPVSSSEDRVLSDGAILQGWCRKYFLRVTWGLKEALLSQLLDFERSWKHNVSSFVIRRASSIRWCKNMWVLKKKFNASPMGEVMTYLHYFILAFYFFCAYAPQDSLRPLNLKFNPG